MQRLGPLPAYGGLVPSKIKIDAYLSNYKKKIRSCVKFALIFMQKNITALDNSVTADALPAVIVRSAILAGSSISLHIDELPFSALDAGARTTSVSDKICNHSDPPSGGSLSSWGSCQVDGVIYASCSCL
jgi:hypothetical protein